MIVDDVRQAFLDKEVTGDVEAFVKQKLEGLLTADHLGLNYALDGPTVVLVAGVNGSGKTTSIAKLAYRLHSDGKKVLVAACDTFRAAAVEQLTIWSERIGCDIVKSQQGSDPASVAHDACVKATARKCDVMIVDTAGRLHTQAHLMNELEKILRVVKKQIPSAPHEVLLVLDATTGQNALVQQKFKETRALHRHHPGEIGRHGQRRGHFQHQAKTRIAGQIHRGGREARRHGTVRSGDLCGGAVCELMRSCPSSRKTCHYGPAIGISFEST